MSRGPNSVPTSSFQPQASAKPPILIDDIDAPGHLGKVEQHVPNRETLALFVVLHHQEKQRRLAGKVVRNCVQGSLTWEHCLYHQIWVWIWNIQLLDFSILKRWPIEMGLFDNLIIYLLQYSLVRDIFTILSPLRESFPMVTLWLFNTAMKAMAHENRWQQWCNYEFHGDFPVCYVQSPEGNNWKWRYSCRLIGF